MTMPLNGMKPSIISQTVTDYLTVSSHHNCLCLALSCLWKSMIPPLSLIYETQSTSLCLRRHVRHYKG